MAALLLTAWCALPAEAKVPPAPVTSAPATSESVAAPVATAPVAAAAVTPEQVAAGMDRGVKFLLDRQQPDGTWQTPYEHQYPGGAEALAVLAAMSGGADPQSPKVQLALDYLGRLDPATTYARAMRTMVYARLGRAYARKLAADVTFLVQQQGSSGGWGYGPGHPATEFQPDWTDSSNTFVAVLALNDAAEAGAPVPPATWRRCRSYWAGLQKEDGGWGYQSGGMRSGSYASMTAAGTAALQLIAARLATAGPLPPRGATAPAVKTAMEDQKAIDAAMTWLSQHYDPRKEPDWPTGLGPQWDGYFDFCLFRATLASGQRRLSDQPWFAQVPAGLLARQRGDGAWGEPAGEPSIVSTCFAILSLAQGRQVVLVNKLAFSDKDSLDAQNLCRYLARAAGRHVVWQSVTPASLAQAIDEAPILYISGQGKCDFPATMETPICRLIENGGSVIVQAIGGDAEFLQQAQDYFLRLFPRWQASPLAADHPACSLEERVNAVPRAVCLGDAARTRAFLLKSDFSGPWHGNLVRQAPWAFRFAANVAAYTTDQQPWPERLAAPAPAAATAAALRTIRVARVRHDGDWDVCPHALDRLSQTLAAALNLGIDQQAAVDLAAAVPEGIDLLWLTGNTPPHLAPAQVRNLVSYVKAGGTVFVDSAAGRAEFVQALCDTLEGAFGHDSLNRLPAAHAIFTGDFLGGMGSDVTSAQFTRALAREQGDDHLPAVRGVELNGRLAVIVSEFALTGPMEGVATFGCRGLATPDARRLACNVVLYSGRQPATGSR